MAYLFLATGRLEGIPIAPGTSLVILINGQYQT